MYINPENEYPRYLGDIQLEHPEWNEGQPLPNGWKYVISTLPPEPEENQKVVEIFPVKNGNDWFQAWDIVDLTPEELEYKNAPTTVREKLALLDFTEAEIKYLLRGLR